LLLENWQSCGKYGENAGWMQRSEKAQLWSTDSSHVGVQENRISEVGARFLPMDDPGCNQ
jgi:hypothetical protein